MLEWPEFGADSLFRESGAVPYGSIPSHFRTTAPFFAGPPNQRSSVLDVPFVLSFNDDVLYLNLGWQLEDDVLAAAFGLNAE